jgi:hypothetical protein
VTAAVLERDLVIVTCAISAGIHGALIREHFAEGAGAGTGFLVAAVLLGALVIALTRRPSSVTVAGAVVVFAGLLASYALATTTGLPLLHPHAEPVDDLAGLTKAVETVGLVAASLLLWRERAKRAAACRRVRPFPEAKRNIEISGTTTYRPIPLALTALIALFSALAALALSGGHNAHAHVNTPPMPRATR